MKIVFFLATEIVSWNTAALFLHRRLRDTKTFLLFIAINIYLGVLFS